MKLEYVSSKTINFPYIIGKKVTLQVNGSVDNIKALIFHADGKEILLSVANKPFFERGKDCFIEVFYREALLRFECRIKKFDCGILYLDMPRQAAIIQQRGFLRVKCDINCNIERFSTGKIKDISAGGAFVIIDNNHNINFLEKENFKLSFGINSREFRLTCAVIDLSDKYLRLEFKDLSQEQEDYISSYCQSKDLEANRRRD